MDLEEFKKKANDIKNDLEPKVKKKAKRAKKKVTDFVDEHFTKDRDDAVELKEKDIVEAEYRDVTDIVNEDAPSDDEGSVSSEIKENENIAEEASDLSPDQTQDSGSDASGENAVESDDSSDQEDSPEIKSEDGISSEDESGSEGENESADNAESEKDESEIERIEGVVVGTMKDKYNQFKVNVLPKVKDVASNVGNKVKDAAQDLAPKAKETAKNVGIKVKDTAQELAPKAKETAINVGNKVKETAAGFGPKAKETAQSLGSKVKQTAHDFGPKAKDTVVDTAKQVGPKVYEGAKKAGETISFQGYRLRKTLGKKMKNSIKKKLGFSEDDDSSDGVKYYEVKGKKTNKFFAHAKTVSTHRRLVFKHCVKAGIPIQGLLHDLSKYSPSEFYYGVKFYSGDRSPNEGEREDHGFSYAWMHHKGRNKHHFEYWNDYNIVANKALPVKMPLKYVIEMFCDRVAASKVYLKSKYTNKSPYEYFDKGRSRRTIHQETSDFLEKLLKMLAEKGEPYTFMYIKWYRKHHTDY